MITLDMATSFIIQNWTEKTLDLIYNKVCDQNPERNVQLLLLGSPQNEKDEEIDSSYQVQNKL